MVGKTDDLQRPAGSSSERAPEEPWASSVPCGLCDWTAGLGPPRALQPGPPCVTSEPERPSPRWPTGLTELSCCGLQSQPQLGGWAVFLLPPDTPLAPRQSYLTPNGTPTGRPPSADTSIHVSSQPMGGSAGLCDLGQAPGPRGLCPLWSLRTLTREIPRGPQDSGCPSAWRAPGWAGGWSRGRGEAQTFQACPSALQASGLTASSRGLRAPALLSHRQHTQPRLPLKMELLSSHDGFRAVFRCMGEAKVSAQPQEGGWRGTSHTPCTFLLRTF